MAQALPEQPALSGQDPQYPDWPDWLDFADCLSPCAVVKIGHTNYPGGEKA